MKYPLQSIALFSLAILVLSCSHKDPTPDTSPYLYIHSGQFQSYELEKWIIVTNGSGELVGYKKIDPVSDETILTKRSASIKDKINVYKIVFEQSNTTTINVQTTSTLGVTPGQHCYLGAKTTSSNIPSNKTFHINMFKIPDKSSVIFGSGSYAVGMSQIDLYFDGVIDTTKIDFSPGPSASVYPITVYTRTAPKYVTINDNSSGITKFSYPTDFLNFDHVIDVPTAQTPELIMASGAKGNTTTYFVNFFLTSDLNKVEANQSFKLCYNDGYDSYSTFYKIGNKQYFRVGTIPSAGGAIIPNRSITVTNHDLYSFAATVPSQIDYRSSGYSYSETVSGTTSYYYLGITNDITKNDSFDLKLPDEFVTAHGLWDFTKYSYGSTSFVELENNDPYSKAVDILFGVPNSNYSVGQYSYTVN